MNTKNGPIMAIVFAILVLGVSYTAATYPQKMIAKLQLDIKKAKDQLKAKSGITKIEAYTAAFNQVYLPLEKAVEATPVQSASQVVETLRRNIRESGLKEQGQIRRSSVSTPAWLQAATGKNYVQVDFAVTGDLKDCVNFINMYLDSQPLVWVERMSAGAPAPGLFPTYTFTVWFPAN
jgi:hypothetical protein